MAAIDVNGRSQVMAMFKLRGRLTVRQFSQQRGRLVVASLLLFILLPLAGLAAFGTGVGYRQLPDHWPTALLGLVLFVLWMLWITLPIFVSPINEAFDISRLMIYPIRRRDLITAVFLGTLFDYPTYIMLPLFGAIIYGFGTTSTILIVLLALLLSYGHLIMIGQLVGTAIGGLVQSRRVRDATIILMSVIGGSCYFINLATQRFFENLADTFSQDQMQALLATNPLDYFQWLPPGAAAKAIERASVGEWFSSFFWLTYSAFWLVIVIWLWYKLLLRLTTGEGYFLNIPNSSAAKPETAVVTASMQQSKSEPKRDWFGWLPDDIAVVAHKEVVTVWRLPQRRAGIIQGLLFPILVGAAFLFTSDQPNYPAWIGVGVPLYGLFAFWGSSQNMLSWEGRGLPTILLTPNPRHRIFVGKGIILALIAGIPYLIFGSGLIWLSQHWLSVMGVLTGLFVGIASMSVTMVASVLFPIPINLESKRGRSAYQSGGSFLTGCATVTVVPFSLAIVGIPPILPLVAAYFLDQPLIAVAGLIFSIIYGVLLFRIGCLQAGKLLLKREPEMIELMKLPEDD